MPASADSTRPGDPGERRHPVDRDAEQASGVAVLGRGPDGDAEAAQPEEQGQFEGDQRDDGEDLEVAAGEVDVAEVDDAA